MKSALLVGATGLIGGHCLKLLLEDDSYSKVIVLVRKPIILQHKKLEQHVVDFDHLDRYASLIKAHDVFCCLGTTIRVAGSQGAFRKVDFTYPVQTAAYAVKNGAEQFLIVTSVGADSSSRVFYTRVKGEVEEAIGKLSFRALHIFRPSMLLGERKESRRGEQIGMRAMQLISFTMVGKMRKYRPIQASTVALAMIRAAQMNKSGTSIYESDQIESLDDTANT